MPPRKDPAANALSASSSAGAVAGAGGATGANGLGVLTKKTLEELENKRDAFVEAMNTLSYAAKTAARTGYDYFNILASASGLPPSSLLPPDLTSTSAPHMHANGFIPINYNAHVRAASTAPGEPWGRIQTLLPTSVEEGAEDAVAEDTGKNKRKRGPKRKEKKDADPDAPKKPISAYFQFTAAARPIIRKDMGGGIPAKDVITEAASRWQALPVDEKNAWLADHHKQMVQWYIDTNAYRASKGLPLEPVPKDYQPGATPINLLPAALEEEEEEEEEEEATTPDEADEDEDEDEDENPATPPPPPAKKARGAPKRAANGDDAVTSVVTAPAPRKRGRPAKNPNAHANANSTPSTIAPAPSTPTTAPEVSTPDTSKRKRAPSIKAKEAKELAAAKAPTRSPSKNTSTPITTPTAAATATTNTTAAATTAGVDAVEKQLQEEVEGSITVSSSAGGGGLRVKVVETPGSMREKKERKKRKAKGEE